MDSSIISLSSELLDIFCISVVLNCWLYFVFPVLAREFDYIKQKVALMVIKGRLGASKKENKKI